jgi:hypothetical protein
MSSSPRLATHRTTLRERLLSAYEPLGQLTLVYLLGSLASGYTEEADLDLVMVWGGAEVPAASQRKPLVARLDERPGVSPFVVDYRDIHLERYVIDRQEYNVAHQTLASFESLLQSILDGKTREHRTGAGPTGAYGELAWDRESRGQQWKSRLRAFPATVKRDCRRAVLAHRQTYLTDLFTG